MTTISHWKKRLLMLLLVCLTGGMIWFGYVLWRIAQVEKQAVPRPADVAIVLGAAVWEEQPSPGLRERLNQALSLYRQGYVPYLIVSGGLGEGKTIDEATVMKRYLVEQGIPAERVLMENKARNTYENLLFSKELMDQHSFHTALIVSHGYHLARAVEIAQTLGMDANPVGVQSQVLLVPFHKTREVLAYTKWHLSRYF